MNETLPCAGCSTPLPPEATGCQICLRPRTKQEIVRGYAYLREEKARRKALPFKIAGAILVVAITVKVSWDNREGIKSAADAGKKYVSAKYEKFTDAKSYVPKQTPTEPPPVNPADLPPTDPRSAYAPPAQQKAYGGGPGEAGRGAPAASAPKTGPAPAKLGPLAATDWRVSGQVYDLATLEPVAGVQVSFQRPDIAPVNVVSGEDGRYEADIAKGEGWTVRAASGEHRPGQVLDIEPPYRQRDADERRAALENLSDSDLSPAPVSWKRSRSKVRLDLVLVRHHWPGE